MRVHEFAKSPRLYIAIVRVLTSDANITTRTTVRAESPQHAKAILTRIFGEGNVLSIMQDISEGEVEVEGAKMLSPDEQRVKAMNDQAKRLQQQAKQIKAQNAVKKAQAQVANAVTQSRTTSAA